MKTNFPNISDMSEEAKEVTEAIANDTIEKVDGEVIDKAYDEIISSGPREISQDEINALNAFMNSNPALMAAAQALERGENLEDGVINTNDKNNNVESNIVDVESKEVEPEINNIEEGELINAAVSINNATGERQIVNIDTEFKGDNTSFDDLVDDPDIDNKDFDLDDEVAEGVLKEKFSGISATDMANMIQLVNDYKEGKVKGIEAFNKLPEFLKSSFNSAATNSGVPINKINSYKKHFVKTVFDDILTDAELEQTSVDLNNQIARIYKDYGNDVALLYQSSIFEKIKTLNETIEDIKNDSEVENKEEKINNIQAIIDGLYESIYLDKFAEFAVRAKIKPFEMEKPEKLYREFLYKYNNSKFIISNIVDTIAPLQKYCNLSEEDATAFTVLFCKYTKNMRPSNLADHTFMYYVIANILSINALGGNIVEDENNPIKNEFIDILTTNISNIINIRKTKEGAYESKKIPQEYMDKIIVKANEKAKELEEEEAKMEAEMKTEETENNSEVTVQEIKSGLRKADSEASNSDETITEISENIEE